LNIKYLRGWELELEDGNINDESSNMEEEVGAKYLKNYFKIMFKSHQRFETSEITIRTTHELVL